jgi:hypothetical protein
MSEVVQLDIAIERSMWEGQFDALEIWRSRLSEGGPYEPLMGDSWSPARIPAVEGDPPSPAQNGPSVPIVGKTLELRLDESEDIVVTFTGVDPLTFAQAATQIQSAASSKLRAFVLNGHLIVETLEAGSGAVLRVVGGEAAPLLNLPTAEPESLAFGLEARLALSVETTTYSFTDKHSDSSYFYKARFYNSVDKTYSAFGTPFTGRSIAGVAAAKMVRGFVDFVDPNGKARANQEVLVHTRSDGAIIDGKVLVPTAPTRLLSDTNGHVELMLVRGTKITVAIAGTDIVRDIDVPTDAAVSSFNLLDPTKGTNDAFKVQVPVFEYAARRSL